MSSRKILVIEDDPDILNVLDAQLTLDKFDVKCASCGKEGLDIFREWNPDMVILDLNLPDIDGLDVCANLRKCSNNVAIIAVTARDSISDKLRGFRFGVDDYVVKPFEYLELRARIDAVFYRLDRWVRGNSVGTAKREVELLPNERRIRIDDKVISLTNKEFALLELMVLHAGEVLTREYLCSQLWPDSDSSNPTRALDVQIRRLRKKIEKNPARPEMIITHPGVGYRFENG